MRIQPELSSVAIVIVGSFNPTIFTPDWFARHGLLNAKEAEASEVQVIHAQFSTFQIESLGLSLRVEPQRFQLQSTEAPYVALLDFVVRTFKELLPHTPLVELGINLEVHFDVGSHKARDDIGEQLAPKKAWGDWASSLTTGSDPHRNGMTSLTMQEWKDDDRPRGFIRAKIEPSNYPGLSQTGIFMQINDHFEVQNKEHIMGGDEIMEILEKSFEISLGHSEWIIDQIMSLKT